ncbi:hypothetical protein LWI28_002378 [Acer negundo]|uniref:Uncharacterized protein n=1 Tax=Acer negundo TaxID=4023 RepID=A0AAD5NHW6_ACENE|nr:hypothetical protein LWI28_002378 [Acer negundo]
MDTRRRYNNKGGFYYKQDQTRYSNRDDFSESYAQQFQRSRSDYREQPIATLTPSVPVWEKQFCTKVGSISWTNFLEGKKYMHIFENVVNWNDSAGEEAFNNAKSRYWAKVNGFPCDIPLPDPDIYINEVDWNSGVDPEWSLDLEQVPDSSEEAGHEDENGLNSLLLMNQTFTCAGWGDEAEFPKAPSFEPTGWGDEADFPKAPSIERAGWGEEANFQKDAGNDANNWGKNCAPNNGDANSWEQNLIPGNEDANSWEKNCAPANETGKDDGWGSYVNDSLGGNNQWGNNYDQQWNNILNNNYNKWNTCYNEAKNVDIRRGDGNWRTRNWDSSRKREGTCQNMSRYKTSRFHHNDENQMDQGWKNRRGWKKKSNVSCR